MEYMLGAHLLGIPCGSRTAPGLVINVLSGPMPSPAGHEDVCGCRYPRQPSVHLMTARNFESPFAGRENNKTPKKPRVIFLVLSHGHSGQSSCFDRSCVCLSVCVYLEARRWGRTGSIFLELCPEDPLTCYLSQPSVHLEGPFPRRQQF